MSNDFQISDLFKDVHGFRPGADYMAAWNLKSHEEKTETYNRLCDDLDYELNAERDAKIAAEKTMDEYLSKMMKDHNIDLKTAVRWEEQAMESNNDYDYDRLELLRKFRNIS